MNKELFNVPLSEAKKILEIRNKKNDVVRRQAYEEAARLRDEERDIENKYPILREIKTADVINYIRDKKIDDLLDDTKIGRAHV